MTSKFSIDNRELLQRISSGEAVVGIDFGNLIVRGLAAFRLAEMESEPVVFTDERNLHHIAMGRETSLIWGKQNSETGDIPLYRHAQPAPVVPDELLNEIDDLLSVCRVYACRSRRSGSEHDIPRTEKAQEWLRACRSAMLQAQPQNAPQNIPEIIPDCWCRTCRPVTLNDMRFVVCPDCGNKRCPRANDHRNACTGSNEPGQEGSAYPDTPREVKP